MKLVDVKWLRKHRSSATRNFFSESIEVLSQQLEHTLRRCRRSGIEERSEFVSATKSLQEELLHSKTCTDLVSVYEGLQRWIQYVPTLPDVQSNQVC